MTLLEFVAKWKDVSQTEKAASQSHFIDLCHALGQKTPTDADPTGESYAFEKYVAKVTAGDKGFADVWKRNFFAWEYKGKHKDLNAAYVQLNAYHDALENPPLLVVCDMERFEVHVKVTNNAKQRYDFNLDDIAANVPTATCPLPPADVLRALFEEPGRLTPHKSPEEVTEEVAREFAQIAVSLEKAGHDRHAVARFLIRIVFCLFAEDVGLLEADLFTRTVRNFRNDPDLFARRLRELFREMATGGGFGDHRIPHFNGGLFDAKFDAKNADDESAVLPLTGADLSRLLLVAQKDWRRIEPSVFGTLFERSLGDKRAQLGAHYTRRTDIEAIVEPVLMPPLRRRWEQVQQIAEVKSLAQRRLLAAQKPGVAATAAERKALQDVRGELTALLQSFTDEIAAVRVLDPACGSGNFLLCRPALPAGFGK